MSAISLWNEQSPDAVSVAMLIKAYLRHLKRRSLSGDVSVGHYENVEGDLRRYSAFMGDKLVADCRQFDLTEWLKANPNWKSVHSQKRAISSVLSCFAWGADEEEGPLIDRNPYRSPKKLKGKPALPRRPALKEEYRALMLVGSLPLRKALLMLWRTGCRTCELRGMRWEDVVWGEHPHIRLEHHKTVRRTGTARIIPLSPAVVRFLRWMQKSRNTGHIFLNCDNTPWTKSAFTHHLRRYARLIGLDNGVTTNITGYCLRHSYACAAVEGGATFEQVADQLGNSAEVVRKVYASHTRRHLGYMIEIAAKIARNRRGK